MTDLATTHDMLYQGKLTLEQPRRAYRFGSDAMLLAAAIPAHNPSHEGRKVLELGCGVGAVLLAGHYRAPGIHLTGIERETEYAELARANIRRNNAENHVTVVQGDVCDRGLLHLLGVFDHVVANPPYYEVEKHSAAPDELRRVARQQAPGDLGEWLQAANRFVKPKGSVTVIHSVEKLDELVDGLKKFCGAIRIFPLWPQAVQACKRVIVTGQKGSRAPLSLLPGLVLHQADGQLAPCAAEIINQGRSLWDTLEER